MRYQVLYHDATREACMIETTTHEVAAAYLAGFVRALSMDDANAGHFVALRDTLDGRNLDLVFI